MYIYILIFNEQYKGGGSYGNLTLYVCMKVVTNPYVVVYLYDI